uniref:Solute carrier family 3 member 2a n=1 Tax=Cyprinus carpio carpio TaxID=630221 RepID=A0A9J8B6Y5_CYPCA
MNKEDDMREVELNEMDQEKQPMTGETPTGTEKNGCVKVKVPEDTEVKFTGLSKEELMKVAGTAGWVRTRWALLVLFWLGWVGMLAGAIVIIVQAPRCKPIPEMNWWNEGLLYQISDVNEFSENGLKGVEEKLDYLTQMKVKGLILGPIHTVDADQLDTLDLVSVKSAVGTENDLKSLLEQAHKKGIPIVLNLTPSYDKASVWLNNVTAVAEKIKDACTHWLEKGFDGIFLPDLRNIKTTKSWQSIQAIFNKTEETKQVALMGSVTSFSADEVSLVLNRSGVDLLLTELSDPPETGELKKLYSSHPQTILGWSLGSPASRTTAAPVRLFQMLLFTLPGTPVFSAGDEVGLKAGEKPQIMWDLENPAEEKNTAAKTLQEERIAVRDFFKTLSDLRGKERSLLHGEYISLHSSATSLAFLRLWDQSSRYLTAMNWGNDPVTMILSNSDLPAQAQVRLTTDAVNLAVDSMVSLEKLQLGPKQAVLLSYPYAG